MTRKPGDLPITVVLSSVREDAGERGGNPLRSGIVVTVTQGE